MYILLFFYIFLSDWDIITYSSLYSLFNYFQDWELRLVSVQSYDSGEYRCQATTHPPSFIATSLAVVGELLEITIAHTNLNQMSTSGFLRTVSPEMHTINLICTFIYKDVQTEQYISLQSAEIVKILLYLLPSRTILSQNTQNILIYP